jgi:hypothetical protein
VIDGQRYGIHISFSGNHEILTAGKISGGEYAILGESGIEQVFNVGTLEGNVSLGDGNDTFLNVFLEESGIVTGTISLGKGDDIFDSRFAAVPVPTS